MKVRLAENALRLRLTQDEVAALGSGDPVETAARLPGDPVPFRCRLELRPGGGPAVERDAEGLRVALPREAARAWTAGEAPGITLDLPTAGVPLHLVVETDLRP